jgi:hypothetical protein
MPECMTCLLINDEHDPVSGFRKWAVSNQGALGGGDH